MATKYDLLIKGAQVIDPSQGLEEVLDIAFLQGKVAVVAANIPEGEAREVYDGRGKIVTPGLVDLHTHFYYGVDSFYSRDSRKEFLPTGVTCAVDGGSAGSAIYNGLRDLIIKPSELHLYAFLNIVPLGLPGLMLTIAGKIRDVDMANVESTARAIQKNRDTLVGVKVVLHGGDGNNTCLPLLKYAVEAAEKAQCPLLCHIDGGFSLKTLTDHLRPGDTITHCFQGNEPTVIDERGKVRPEIVEAVKKGVILDIAPAGTHHLAWKVAEAAARDGLWPQVIATDFATPDKGMPLYNLPDCMSMMLSLGMPLTKVVEAATSKPAAVIGKADKHGSLKPGVAGDATVLEMQSGEFTYLDMKGEKRTVAKRLVPVTTVLGGSIWQAAGEKKAA